MPATASSPARPRAPIEPAAAFPALAGPPAHDYARAAPVRLLSGAQAVRIVDGGHARVAAHAHDWPVLSLYLAGGYDNESELGETRVASPSVMLYAPGAAHANRAGAFGLEQIDIELDPAWIGAGAMPCRPAQCWIGGPVAAAGRRLAIYWSRRAAPEAMLARATRDFLRFALSAPPPPRPAWLARVVRRLDGGDLPATGDLAREAGVGTAWLAEAYRAAMGEGLAETVRRRRVELAGALLRQSDLPAAEIAAAAGFCDQSHMIRAFNALLGRTPARVRTEWAAQRRGSPAGP